MGKRRVGRVKISKQLLAEWLQLPRGVQILRVDDDPNWASIDTFTVVLEDHLGLLGLPVVPDGAMLEHGTLEITAPEPPRARWVSVS